MEAEEDELVQESITENESYVVYFGWNPSQGDEKHTKIGKTGNLKSRESSLNTSFSEYGMNFEYLVKCNSDKEEAEIENYLQAYFYDYSTMHFKNHTGGTEWFNKRFKLEDISEALSIYGYSNEIISDLEEIDRILNEHTIKYEKAKQKKKEIMSELNKKIKKKCEERQKKIKRNKQSIKDENKWFKRQYQTEIIKLGLDKLSEFGKFYLELATGAGKSFIVFNILKYFRPDIIFCLSPRLKINEQNISQKYLSILDDEYETFNLSEDKDIDKFMKKDCKKIIVGCYKSINKVYDIIINHNIIDPSFWFDESHNSVENWINKLDNKIINYLMTSENIKYRIFTSASPDKEIVNSYENIFGKLYNLIKVKELIDLKYLCPLKPMMYYHNSDDIDILKYSLDNFTELKRTWGLSFHNEQDNAKIMFEKHLTLFNNDETDIKPFLIISDKTKFKTKYKYNDINEFENTKNSIAYVVRQCDMGYDKKEIDFIIFSDRKMSYKDIIQCIGRGLRPDKLGSKGINLKKECILLLPVFIDDEIKNKYKKVIEVLRYLILDLEIDVYELIELNRIPGNTKPKSSNIDYDGLNSIKAELIDLLETSNVISPMNKERLIKFCINNNIQNQKDYNEFRKLNPFIKLRDNTYEYPNFKWKPIVDPNSEKHYSSIEECENKKLELFNRLESEKDEDEMDEIYENETNEGFIYLNKLDSKFPPYTDLTYFY